MSLGVNAHARLRIGTQVRTAPDLRSDGIRLPQLGSRARFRARYPARFGIILSGRVRVSLGVYAYARLRIGTQFRTAPTSVLRPNPTSATWSPGKIPYFAAESA